MALKHLALVLVITALTTMSASSTHADSWCASPLEVHEWGVHIVGSPDTDVSVWWPSWFYTSTSDTRSDKRRPVRELPADNGMRALPVLHFYGVTGPDSAIPVAVEVGFKSGRAAAWYPAVDVAREAKPTPRGYVQALPAGVSDPTLSPTFSPTLTWERLDLTRAATGSPRSTEVAWVNAARAIKGALWVQNRSESERFVFYEATTQESPALQITRGPAFGRARRQYVVTNTSAHPVHDVLVIHREGAASFVVEVPHLAAGKSATFVLEDHRLDDSPTSFEKATLGRLETLLVDADTPSPDMLRQPPGTCVMMRDPAVANEPAQDHRLFRSEVELLLDTWKARLFGTPRGTTVLYREDQALLSEVMPLSIYTDMFHYIRLRRASLALWPGVTLP